MSVVADRVELSLNETFFDYLLSENLYEDYNGMHQYILEYEAGFPNMDSMVYENYIDKCQAIVEMFRNGVRTNG